MQPMFDSKTKQQPPQPPTRIRSQRGKTNGKAYVARVFPQWNPAPVSSIALSHEFLPSCREAGCKRNADVSPLLKTVVRYIYSIYSVIGKLRTNDVNTAGPFST